MPASDRARELEALHVRAPRHRHRSLVAHWLGGWLRTPRAASPEPLPDVVAGQLGVTFGGHAMSLLRYGDSQVVCDPMLGRWIGGVRRAVEPGLTDVDLAAVDLVLVTQLGRGHLHLPTLARLPRAATIVLPRGGAALVSRLGFARVVELAPGSTFSTGSVHLLAVDMPRGDGGLAYLVRGDGPSVFVCGDGGYHDGFAAIGQRWAPDVALLPIGGYWPRSFRERHMSPLDALAAFEDLRARLLVPVRHGAFALSYEHLDEPAAWLAELVAARGLEAHVCALRPGQSELLVPSAGVRRRGTGDDARDDVVDDPVASTLPQARRLLEVYGSAVPLAEPAWGSAPRATHA